MGTNAPSLKAGGSLADAMPDEPIVHEEEGTWRWVDERVGLEEAFESPVEAVEAGVAALREAVDEERLTRGQARDIAMEARFALGGHEHHLGADDREAFQALSELEDDLVGR